MLLAAPFYVPVVVSLYLKNHFLHCNIIDKGWLAIGLVIALLLGIVHEWLHCLPYPRQATAYIGILPKRFMAYMSCTAPLRKIMTCCRLCYLLFWASFHGLFFCYALPQPVHWLHCVGAVLSWEWFPPVLTICTPIACIDKFLRTDGYRPERTAATGIAVNPNKQMNPLLRGCKSRETGTEIEQAKVPGCKSKEGIYSTKVAV